MNTLSAFGRFNEQGGGGGCCPLSADLTSGRGGAVRFRPIQSVRCPPSRPIQSFNHWAEGAELLLQGGGGGAPFSPEGGGGGAMPPLGTPLGRVGVSFTFRLVLILRAP